MRLGLVARLIRLRVAEYDARPPGDLVARVTSDSSLLKNAATTGIVMVLEGAITLVGAVALMASLHLGLLTVTAAVLVAVAAVLLVVLPRIRRAVLQAQQAVGAMGAALDRTLGATRTVKANGAEARETALAGTAVDEAYRAGLTNARHSAVVAVVSSLAMKAAFLVVLGMGGALVASGDLTTSALIAFVLYLFYLSAPISSLIGGVSALQQGLGAVERIEQVHTMPIEPDVHPPPVDPGLPIGAPRIDVRNVTFAYPHRPPALRGVSFTAAAGRRTALVGLSGSGKTTLFALLLRFYEPHTGAIHIDGRDITTLSRAEVRRRIAYVEQDAPVLAGTIRDNLLYAAPDATEGQIAEVLQATLLARLIDELDDGLDTPVGARGVTLSGGERQRLAIARALLRRADVLLLDEPNSHLDARNEQALRDVIARVSESCTVLLIAHRLSTVTDVDQIVVIDQGQVHGSGTHTALAADDDLYRELATTQRLLTTESETPAAATG